MTTIDLDMLANDIAKLLDRYGCPIDATADDIRPELEDFVDRINAATSAQDQWEITGDAAQWSPALDVAPNPAPQSGPAPAMAYEPWRPSQGVDLGQTDRGDHYWRCPVCHTWAGPYSHIVTGKRAGTDHRFDAHDLPAARRTEARKAARRIGGMTAAVFDTMVDQMAAAHALPTSTVHLVISRIAGVVGGYGHADDLVDGIVRDGLTRSTDPTRQLVLDLAGELGHADWLARMGA
jgi:hypothetical protein